MAEPRRLLFLVNEALFFTTHRMSVALAARAANFDVHVAAPFDAVFVRVIEENGFPYHPIPLERGGRSPIGELRLIAAMAGVIVRVKPDLVHNVAMKPVIWGGLAARLLGVPAVVNAIIEGLYREYKIDHIDMPATAERVWIAIREHQRRHSL